jgi:transposase InsO family protein
VAREGMTLRVRTIVDQRLSAMEWLEEGLGVTEVAERLGVSRQAVYGWKARFDGGRASLEDASRRPHHSPSKTASWIEQRLIKERRRWGFGAKKILRRLQDSEPEVAWPPRSTIDAIFKREGLVIARKRERPRFAPVAAHLAQAAREPGEVMTGDYKGQFRMRNSKYCYPLTVADPISRYLLACDAYEEITSEQTWASLVRVFCEHGLPQTFHMDNGIPFGTSGHGVYSTLSARLMKHGVQPTYNRPGHPQDNGRHERMHRSLLEGCIISPAANLTAQQAAFDQYQRIFNFERPHESLGGDRPAKRHRSCARAFPRKEPVLEYESYFETRLVDGQGRIQWRGERVFLSGAFANERVGFERVDYTLWRVHFGAFVIGSFPDEGSPPRLSPPTRTR